ncbi:MAG: tetratricopeptide repeat protein [Pseudobdellovibrionaceae bacterium]|nr:MAG: tetratricopeptide repeat protein [Pseudobdellovibrionaceae bacterium]
MRHTLAIITVLLSISLSAYAQSKGLAPNAVARERKAKVYAQKEQWDKVIETLSSYTDVLTYNGLMDLATAYRNKGDFKNEIRTLDIAIAENPTNYVTYFLEGRALKSDGQMEQAIIRFRKVLKMQPKHEPSYQAILDIFLEQKNNYESRNIVNDMINNLGEKPLYYSHLCHLFTLDAFLNQAEENCKKAVKMAPDTEQNYIDLGRVQTDLQDIDAARKTYSDAVKRFSRSEPVLWAAGDFFFKQKSYRTAARYLKKAISINTESARSHLSLAQTTFALGQFDVALKQFETACRGNKEASKLFRQAYGQLEADGNGTWARKFSERLYVCQ